MLRRAAPRARGDGGAAAGDHACAGNAGAERPSLVPRGEHRSRASERRQYGRQRTAVPSRRRTATSCSSRPTVRPAPGSTSGSRIAMTKARRGDPEPLPAPVNAPAPANEFCPTPLPGNPSPVREHAHQRVRGHRQHRRRHLLHPPSDVASRMGRAGRAPLRDARRHQQPVRGVLAVARPVGGPHASVFSSNRDTGVPGVHEIRLERAPFRRHVNARRACRGADARRGAMHDRTSAPTEGRSCSIRTARGRTSIYVATRGRLDGRWSTPQRLSENVNSDTADEQRPSLSRDGTRLYFGSTRANAELGGSGADIYVSTRSGAGDFEVSVAL